MMRPVERKGAPRVGPVVVTPVIGPIALVGGVIGVGQFVVFRFGDPTECDPQPRQAPEPFAREVAVEVLVEQPVVAQFVGGDAAADFLQHRLVSRVAQRGVIGAGADLDDAARHHLAGARAAARAVAVEIDLVAGLEAGEGGGEIKLRVGQRRPARQRRAVLDLFLAPAPRGFLELGIVGEDPAQMTRVGGAIVLDEARRLDDTHQLGIEQRASKRCHGMSSSVHEPMPPSLRQL